MIKNRILFAALIMAIIFGVLGACGYLAMMLFGWKMAWSATSFVSQFLATSTLPLLC